MTSFVSSQWFERAAQLDLSKNSSWISHQPELYLPQLIFTKLTFFWDTLYFLGPNKTGTAVGTFGFQTRLYVSHLLWDPTWNVCYKTAHPSVKYNLGAKLLVSWQIFSSAATFWHRPNNRIHIIQFPLKFNCWWSVNNNTQVWFRGGEKVLGHPRRKVSKVECLALSPAPFTVSVCCCCCSCLRQGLSREKQTWEGKDKEKQT